MRLVVINHVTLDGVMTPRPTAKTPGMALAMVDGQSQVTTT
jgi:hypothetical protein